MALQCERAERVWYLNGEEIARLNEGAVLLNQFDVTTPQQSAAIITILLESIRPYARQHSLWPEIAWDQVSDVVTAIADETDETPPETVQTVHQKVPTGYLCPMCGGQFYTIGPLAIQCDGCNQVDHLVPFVAPVDGPWAPGPKKTDGNIA